MRISIDTRTLEPGDIFVPVKGPNFDGHDFIQEALAKGAVRVLDEDLAVLARRYRPELSARVVAVTGSTGKTTTKDMIAAVLAQQGPVRKTSGNYNNEIGLPLTVLRTEKADDFLVVELAMRGLGQIRQLAEVARPEIAVITNTGVTHLELLGSRQNIAQAKSEIIEVLSEMAGDRSSGQHWAVLNRDDEYFDLYAGKAGSAQVLSFGFSDRADIRADSFELAAAGTKTRLALSARAAGLFGPAELKLELPCPGKHNLANALAAAAVGLICGLNTSQIRQGLSGLTLTGQRNDIREVKGVTIIDDTYNANPDSMAAALEVLALHKNGRQGRLLAVLGEMRELGPAAAAAHQQVGRSAAGLDLSALIVVGALGQEIARGAREKGLAEERIKAVSLPEEAGAQLSGLVKKGDVVLFKASRGVHLEKAVARLKEDLERSGKI